MFDCITRGNTTGRTGTGHRPASRFSGLHHKFCNLKRDIIGNSLRVDAVYY